MSSVVLMSVTPMLIASLCAAVCGLVNRCRTHGTAICDGVMFIGMVDLCVTRSMSPKLIAASIVISSVWSHVTSMKKVSWQERSISRFRLVVAFAMAYLALDHRHKSAVKDSLCLTGGDIWIRISAHFQIDQVGALLASLMFTVGVVLSSFLVLRFVHLRAGFRDRISALEPMFAGSAVALMAF